jgi:hypothetical protein
MTGYVNLFSSQPLDGLSATVFCVGRRKEANDVDGTRPDVAPQGAHDAGVVTIVGKTPARFPLYDIGFVFIDPMDRSLLVVER